MHCVSAVYAPHLMSHSAAQIHIHALAHNVTRLQDHIFGDGLGSHTPMLTARKVARLLQGHLCTQL